MWMRCFVALALVVHIGVVLGKEEIIRNLDTSMIESKAVARPEWAGPVKIRHFGNKIHSVEGILIPMKTGGRARPPNPLFGKIEDAQEKELDKGHIIALQLGGPDVSENIVAQNHAWNANGAWRHLEKYLLHLTRHLMGFHKTDPEFSYYSDPNHFDPPKFRVKYLVLPSAYDEEGEPGIYHGYISIMHRPIHVKWMNSGWIVAKQFNFTISPGKGAQWKKSMLPFDWVKYKPKSPGQTPQGPVWKDFGKETQAFIEGVTGNDMIAKSEMLLRRRKGAGSSSGWLEGTVTIKMVLLWNTLFVVVLVVGSCCGGKIRKILITKFRK